MIKDTTNIQKSPSYFPYQKRGDNEKTVDDYYIPCIESGIAILWWNQNNFNSVRNTRKEKVINYNLVNDILDRTEMERVTNPLRFDDASFPATYKNYPVLNKNLEVLFGEERKRIFSPMANVISSDIINEKQEFVNQEFIKMAVNRLMSDNTDEKQTEKEVGDFHKWKLGYRDRRERMVQQIMDWGFKTKYFKELFSKGFEDLVIAGEEIYVADIFGGEPVLDRYDPRNVYTLRSGDSAWIEDSDIIIIDCYMPIGKVIDRYHEHLTPKEIQSIEEHWASGKGGMMQSLTNYPMNFGENSAYISGAIDGDLNDILASNRTMTAAFGGYYDPEGNIRVTRVLWKGMRKIGIMTYYDEDGNELKKFVPEQYKPNKDRGEQVKWEWVSEWYEGTKIGYDIFVKCQVLPFQMRHRDNPSICSPGIVGAAVNFGNNRAKSMVSLAKEWQYSYNAYMYRLNHLFIKSIGKVGVLPLHLLPADWPMEKIMYYASVLGWIPFDAFNEAREGIATGKLGGNMSGVPSSIDMSYAQDIQQCIMMLDFIKRELDDLMGISPQRRGAIDNRETVGGVERSVTQSTLSTERWYDWHDVIRRKALLAFLEVTKTAWKGKSHTKQWVLDDGTLGVLDFDSGYSHSPFYHTQAAFFVLLLVVELVFVEIEDLVVAVILVV